MFDISLIELCDFYGEENITQYDIYHKVGTFPIYSGQTEDDGVLGYIDTFTHEGEYLTWTTYGNAGTVFYRKGKFTIGRNCAGLKIKDKYKKHVHIKYLKILLEEVIKKVMCPDGGRSQAPVGDVKNLTITIPLTYTEQRKLVAKYLKKVRNLHSAYIYKQKCLNQINEVLNLYFAKYSGQGYPLSHWFDIELGVGFSEIDAYTNVGAIPAYTASVDGPRYFVSNNIPNKIKLTGKSLIWARKGNAGSVYYHRTSSDFYISDVSGIIQTKKQYLNMFDYDFLKYYLEYAIKRSIKTAADNNAQVNTSSLKAFKTDFPPYSEQKLIGDLVRAYLI